MFTQMILIDQKPRSTLQEYSAVLLILVSIGLFKFWDVFTISGMTLAQEGDGVGGMSWFPVLETMFRERGWSALLFENYTVNTDVGVGVSGGARLWSMFWRPFLLPFVLSGMEYQNIYDAWCYFIFVASGMSMYFLCRVLGISTLISLLLALIIVSADNVAARYTGHVTIAATFGITLQIAFAVLAGRTGSLTNHLCLAISCWFSFQAMEYYGYYGLIFSAIIYSGYFFSSQPVSEFKKEDFTRTALNIAIAGFVLGVLMMLSYSSLILGKLGLSEQGGAELSQSAHGYGNLLYFSVLSPMELFYSSWLFPSEFENPHEFTFRLGTLFLLVPIGLLLATLYTKFVLNRPAFPETLFSQMGIFVLAGSLLALVGLHPSFALSLAAPLFNFAPMFRVAARSFIFVDIAVLMILGLLLTNIMNYCNNYTAAMQRRIGFAVIFVMAMFLYADGANSPFGKFESQAAPRTAILFNEVSADGGGSVIELPFYPPGAAPELSYNYLYNWSQHGRTLINAPFFTLPERDRRMAEILGSFANDVNALQPDVVQYLGASGVRYIVTNCEGGDYAFLNEFENLSKVAEQECQQLFELNSYSDEGEFSLLIEEYSKRIQSLPSSQPLDCRMELSFEISDSLSVTSIVGDAVIRNIGQNIWTEDDYNIELGAIWFVSGKSDLSHNPNFGEYRYNLSLPLAPGESRALVLDIPLPPTVGNFDLWISAVQPDVAWCFHQGENTLSLPISLEAE